MSEARELTRYLAILLKRVGGVMEFTQSDLDDVGEVPRIHWSLHEDEGERIVTLKLEGPPPDDNKPNPAAGE